MTDSRNVAGSSQIEVSSSSMKNLRPAALHPIEFQELQEALVQTSVISESPHSLAHHDVLAEFLKHFPMAIVLDNQTSWSRTCWLSGEIDGNRLLVVLDTVNGKEVNHVTIDVWSNFNGIVIPMQECLTESQIAGPARSFDNLQIEWDIGLKTEHTPHLVVTLSSNSIETTSMYDLFLSVTCSDFVSEEVLIAAPMRSSVASISLELDWVKGTPSLELDQVFFTVNISDAAWKLSTHAHEIAITWRDAMIQQTKNKLKTETRFENFDELTDYLGLSLYHLKNSVGQMFCDYCLEKTPEICESNRSKDYCNRSALLTGIVTCFNPNRGLTGYLDMVSGDNSPVYVKELGSHRTWRDHISELASIAEDFTPTPLRLQRSKKSTSRGRPPTQLLPRVPLLELFRRFNEESDDYICNNCRFASE